MTNGVVFVLLTVAFLSMVLNELPVRWKKKEDDNDDNTTTNNNNNHNLC